MTKFNEENTKIICKLYSNGIPLKHCAFAVDIDYSTLHRWIGRGKKAKSGKYRDFYLEIMKARTKFVMRNQMRLNENSDWRCIQYLLQVTDPEHYVLQDKMKIETEQEVNTNWFDEDLFNELLDEYEERKRAKYGNY